MAIVVKCICKIRDIKTNKIIAYTIEDESGQQATVKANILKIKMQSNEIEVTNLKLKANKQIVNINGNTRIKEVVVTVTKDADNDDIKLSTQYINEIKRLNEVISEQNRSIMQLKGNIKNLKGKIKNSKATNRHNKEPNAETVFMELYRRIGELTSENEELKRRMNRFRKKNEQI